MTLYTNQSITNTHYPCFLGMRKWQFEADEVAADVGMKVTVMCVGTQNPRAIHGRVIRLQ